MRSGAGAAATRHVDVPALAVLVVNLTRHALIGIGRIGFATAVMPT
jgi:hypothetical protein